MDTVRGAFYSYYSGIGSHCGHAWQERFFSCPVEDTGLCSVLRYVECNPCRAGMVEQAWEYPWSSASVHIGNPDSTGILDLATWDSLWDAATWKDLLAIPALPEELERIRRHTYSGQPLR